MSFTNAFSMNVEPYFSFGHSRISSPFSFAIDEHTVGFLLTRFIVLFCIPLQEYRYIQIPASVLELRGVYSNHTGEHICLVEINEQGHVQLSIYYLLQAERISTIILPNVTGYAAEDNNCYIPVHVDFSITSKVIAVQLPSPISSLLLINWQRGTTDTILLGDNTQFQALCPFSGTAMISTLSNQSIRLWRSIGGVFKSFSPVKIRAAIPTQPVLLADGTQLKVVIRGCFWMGSSLSAVITNIGDTLVFAGPSFIGVIPAVRAQSPVQFFKEFKSGEYYAIQGQITAYCIHDNFILLGTDLGELICIDFCLDFSASMHTELKPRAVANENIASQNPYSTTPGIILDDSIGPIGSVPLVNLGDDATIDPGDSGPLDLATIANSFPKVSCTSLGGSEAPVYPHKVLGISRLSGKSISHISCNTPEYALLETTDGSVHVWPLNFDNVLVIDHATLSLVHKSVSSPFTKKKSKTNCTETIFQPRMKFTAEVEKEKQALFDSINQYITEQNVEAVRRFHELISDEIDSEIYNLTLTCDDAIIDTAGIQYLITLQSILEILREDAPFNIKHNSILNISVPTPNGTHVTNEKAAESSTIKAMSEQQDAIGALLKGITMQLDSDEKAVESAPVQPADKPKEPENMYTSPLHTIMNDADVDANSYLNRFTAINLWSMLLQGFPIPTLPPPSIFQHMCGPRATLAEKSLLKPGMRIGSSLPMDFGSLVCMDASDVCDIYVVGSSNGYIYAGRTSTGHLFAYKKLSSAIQAIKLYPNGLFGIAQYGDGLGTFIINDHDILDSFFFAEPGIRQFVLSHGGGYLAISIESDKKQAVRIRNLESFDIITEITVSQSPIVHMEFVPGDTMLIIVERDGLISGYTFFTRQRLFDCKLRGVCLTSALVAVGRQIPMDVVGQASMYSILNNEEEAILHDEAIVPQIPGGIAASNLSNLRNKTADESQVPYDMLIKHGSVIDSVCYEPVIIFCYDRCGKTYEAISNQILFESQCMEPFEVNLLVLVPPPVSQEILMSNRYIEKVVDINRTAQTEPNIPATSTTTGAAFGLDQEELIVRGADLEMLTVPPKTDQDYYAHYSNTHEIAESHLEENLIDIAADIETMTAEHLEARLNQSKQDYYMGTISAIEQDDNMPEAKGLVDNIIKMSSKLYSQRPISLSEPECQFLLGFTANGWITTFDWPFRLPKAIYRRRIHGSDILAAKLVRGSTLFTLSADELIISHIRFFIPASTIFSDAKKSQHLRTLKTVIQNDENADSLLLKLPITQYLPVIPFDHCSRTTAYGAHIDGKFFNMIVNTADIWVSTDYRAALIKESTRDKAEKITAQISRVKSTVSNAIQQLDQQNHGGDKENVKMELDFNADHESMLVQTQAQYQTRIEQLSKDIADLEQMLKNEEERYECSRSSLQQRFKDVLNFEETMRLATVTNLNAQIDQQDQNLIRMEAAYNEELYQIQNEKIEAVKAIQEVGEVAVEREKNASSTLKGWESMQKRRIATLLNQGHQLSVECELEQAKITKYNDELKRVTVEIENTRRLLQQKDQQVVAEEREIYEVNSEVKRLGKMQYILTNQISSLKSELRPRDELITDMRDRMDVLSGKLEHLTHQWEVITSTLEAEQAAVKDLNQQIGTINRRLRTQERALENLKKEIIVLVTENNVTEWIPQLKTLWAKYRPVYDEISKSLNTRNKAEESDMAVTNELLEHKDYLNSRISTLYTELKQESRKFTTAQAFCLDENSALLTESHRLREENISLKTQLQRVVAMLEEIRLNELSIQTQRRMREHAASQSRSPTLSERNISMDQPTFSVT